MGLHRQQGRALPRQGLAAQRRRKGHARIFLRKGLKWSDGQPFTADDFLFWYEDIYQNKDLVADPDPGASRSTGKTGTHVEARRLHRRLRVPRAVLPLRGHPGGRHARSAVGRPRGMARAALHGRATPRPTT
ncbi:MAG: ABC transporter substrate-binding protein [Candidatus Moduliflexus flocculans]|nr:ABC transporter substrate-binding protein [Candidatus Moduliflexus flocculans]